MDRTGKTILFIYGLLKTGQRNHRLIADQEYLGPAVTEPRYRVFDLGRYGGLVEDPAAGLAVEGELWSVNECCLGELDDYEEVPDLFVRERIFVEGRTDRVEAYFYDRPIITDAPSGPRWPLTGS